PPGRKINGFGGDIDAASAVPEVITLTATNIKNVYVLSVSSVMNAFQERFRMPPIQKPPPRSHSLERVTRLTRTPIGRLQQIDVSGARDIERMPALAHHPTLPTHEREMARPDGAQKLRHAGLQSSHAPFAAPPHCARHRTRGVHRRLR